MIKNAESNLGFALLDTKTGGKGGGGAALTSQAEEFLIKYQQFEQGVYANAEPLWQEFMGDIAKLPGANTENLRVAAVLMASGFSRRMGCNKLLLNLGEKTVIRHVMDQIKQIGYAEQIVVSQYNEILSLGQKLGFITASNPLAQEGKSASIRVAMQNLPDMAGYCFFTGDQILLSNQLLKELLATFYKDPNRIVMPSFGGEWGSPVIFPGFLRDELMQLSGEQGGRQIIEAHKNLIVIVEAESQWEGLDFDTPEEWSYINGLRKLY
jgi:molybdenum cofactor cytidylyltransferase